MQDQEQNRSEPATPFKLSEAKKRGQVAKSLDFNSLCVVGGLAAVLASVGEDSWWKMCGLSRRLFAASGQLQVDHSGFHVVATEILDAILSIMLPFIGAGVAVAVLANLLQTGPIFSVSALQPKFERLNPVAGFKRVFNKRILLEAVKSLLKLSLFGAIAYAFFISLWPSMPTIGNAQLGGQLSWLGGGVIKLLFRLGMALLFIGLFDMALARWQFRKQMMMSPREVKEEVKRREGDPLIRAKIRELQRENLKKSRSTKRVAEADVLITNPQHLAIALRYVRGQMNAPVVLAKGADSWAAEMRSIARRHGIAIVERRRLARQLFRRSQIDQPIPAECFFDVAHIYAELGERDTPQSRYEAVT